VEVAKGCNPRASVIAFLGAFFRYSPFGDGVRGGGLARMQLSNSDVWRGVTAVPSFFVLL
jgi:hypothetical protein